MCVLMEVFKNLPFKKDGRNDVVNLRKQSGGF